MSLSTLERFIRDYSDAHPGPEIGFSWQGGEPLLMGIDFFRQAVALQRKHCPADRTFSNTLQTNGLLINREWVRFFREEAFLVGISLDGPPGIHDRFRRDREGRPTGQEVVEAVRWLQDGQVETNLLTTVHAGNASQPLEVYRFFKDELGVRFMQFIPVVNPVPLKAGRPEGEGGSPVSQESLAPGDFGRFLVALFDEWVREDVGRVFVQLFDLTLGLHLGFSSGLCVFAETCGRAMILEHNGDLYSCDHFVDIPHHLGNIHQTSLVELAAGPRQEDFGMAKRDRLPTVCRSCEVLRFCHGGCPKDRFVPLPGEMENGNYLCQDYRAFFTYVDPPLRLMAEKIRPTL
jgi:uncharacterized protein